MKPILLPILALSITLAMPNSAKAQLKVGDNAPEVSGVTDSGQTLKFSDVYAKQTYTLPAIDRYFAIEEDKGLVPSVYDAVAQHRKDSSAAPPDKPALDR